jgi:RND superfamily putative drug exporter
VLIDATIIRGVLLPASMRVLGDWNWYLPSWLEWLPRFGREDEAAAPPGPDDHDAPGDGPDASDEPAAAPVSA